MAIHLMKMTKRASRTKLILSELSGLHISILIFLTNWIINNLKKKLIPQILPIFMIIPKTSG